MSYWVMSVFVAFLGFVGLFMASAARDFGILAFGLSVVLFCLLLVLSWALRPSRPQAGKYVSYESGVDPVKVVIWSCHNYSYLQFQFVV